MLRRREAAGDTIIEVLLAVTIFSFLAGVTLMLMNQSVNAAQRATEITLVRQQIDAQADMLRALHEVAAKSDTPLATRWAEVAKMASEANGTTDINGVCPDQEAADQSRHLRNRSFALDPDNSLQIIDSGTADKIKPAGTEADTPPYAKVQNHAAYGLWIEPSTEGVGEENKVGAYVFRIRTCWDSPGISSPMQIETVVRLYDVLDGRDFTGEDASVPVSDPDSTPPVITVPHTVTLQGSSTLRCNGQYPIEEQTPSPNSVLFGNSISSGDTYGSYANCLSTSGGATYNCVNYDALYNPTIPEGHSGNYRVIVQYDDAVCGSTSDGIDSMPTASYDYKLKVCKTPQNDGTACGTWLQEKSTTINKGQGGSVVFDNVPLNSADKFGIRWLNNRFIPPDSKDPDFRIKSITFEEQL